MRSRRRIDKYKQLEGTHIKAFELRGKTMYYYVMPDGARAPLAHGDEKASVAAAHALNRILRPPGNIVDRVLDKYQQPAFTPQDPPFSQALDEFIATLAIETYSTSYINQQLVRLRKAERAWQGMTTSQITTYHIAQFLSELAPDSARQCRSMLDRLFRYIPSKGYASARPMADIEKPKRPKRKRARHTWDGHLAVYNAAPEWLQIAINAALYSLQRRSDLVTINLDRDVDLKTRSIRVLQKKTENYERPVYIDIEMGDALYSTVMRSKWSGINCPYLVHCKQRITKNNINRGHKGHLFAVTPGYLSIAYAKARDSAGIYNHLPPKQRPGIHSLRALGIFLYTKAGFPDEYIMTLAGHANEAMKSYYFEGHEKPQPIKVKADLDLSGIDLANINWETSLSSALKRLVDLDE